MAGVVRVRPTGDTVAPAVKRYQWAVSGARPRTSTLTVWSVAASLVTVPLAAIRVKPLSAAISQRTSVPAPRPEPGTASGAGVTRVQSRMPSGSGSPEATPWRNCGAVAAWAEAPRASGRAAAPATAAVALSTWRRRGRAAVMSLTRSVTADRLPAGNAVFHMLN